MWELVWLMSSTAEGGGGWKSLLPFIIIIVIFYLLLIRPQAKRQREMQRMLQSVKKGDNIVTSGGIHGKVVGVKGNNNILVVKIDDNVKVELDRTSVGRIVTPGEAIDEEAKTGKTKP
jgi:preprotein translocase subunit YajC